ncbi:MAG: flavin reductase family protein [Actinomycetaceae bacterium]|nr:flavin reductase family protein [Actinomycetaceae bacterium]
MKREIHLTDEHSPLDNYKLSMSLIVPRPIAWIATYNENGSVNLAPYALFSVVCTEPMMVQFSSRTPKHTFQNAKREGAFTVHIATVDQKPMVAQTAQALPEGESEADMVGLTWTKAPNVNAPLLDDALAAFECEVHSIIEVESAVLTLGRVKAIHTAEAVLAEDGMADFQKLNPLSKLGRQQWGKTEDFI